MFKRKSVLYTWCLSYGLLLLMMVVMCIMLGRNARNQLISEYKSITQTLQKQSNNAINDYFDELERCAYEISNDYLVNDFVSTPDPSGSKYYNLQPIQQSLSVYALQSGGEVSRYLYMDNIGRALSSDAIFRLHEFYASLGLEAAMSAGDFTTLLQDYHYNELYVFETGGKSEALMLTSVPLVGGTPKGTLVQVMNPETIAGMIQSNSAVEDSTTVRSCWKMPTCLPRRTRRSHWADNSTGYSANGSRKPGGILSRSYRCLPSVQSQIGSSAGHSRSCWLWSA